MFGVLHAQRITCTEHTSSQLSACGPLQLSFRCCSRPEAPVLPAPQMILDKKFAGTLDQGAGCLEVFEEEPSDNVYPASLEIMETLGSVVDTLFTRSQKVVA